MATLPRIARFLFAAAACGLWPVSAAGLFLFDLRGLVASLALAGVATCAWMILYLAGRVDALARRSQDVYRQHTKEFNDRQAALIQAMLAMAAGPEPEPEQEQEPSGLRAVS